MDYNHLQRIAIKRATRKSTKTNIGLCFRIHFCGGLDPKLLQDKYLKIIADPQSAMIDMMPAVDFLHHQKIMLDETTIEQRLVNLEQTVAELKRLLIAAPTPSNWLEKVTG